MGTVVTVGGAIDMILTGLLFGFGFAIAQTLWGAIVNALRRKP
jgi:hypothetical protein